MPTARAASQSIVMVDARSGRLPRVPVQLHRRARHRIRQPRHLDRHRRGTHRRGVAGGFPGLVRRGVEIEADPKPRFVACRIAVADLGAARDVLRANGVPFEERMSQVVVPAAEARRQRSGFRRVRSLPRPRAAMVRAMKPNRHVDGRRRHLRQRPAARADRRPVPARIARPCLRHGRAAEGDDGEARDRLRLQDLVRQGEPHQPQGQARPRPRQGAAPSSPTSAAKLGVAILTDVHEREQCAEIADGRRRAADPGVP